MPDRNHRHAISRQHVVIQRLGLHFPDVRNAADGAVAIGEAVSAEQ